MIFIKAYCRVNQGIVALNGRTVFETATQNKSVRDVLSELFESLSIDYRKFYKMDALSRLGFIASELLLHNFDRAAAKPDMAVVIFNRSSSLEADVRYQKTIQDSDNYYPSPSDFVYTLPNIVTGEIAIRNKIYGETAFYVLPQFDGAAICNVINYLLQYTDAKQALAGWLEVDVFKETADGLLVLCDSTSCETGEPLTSVKLNELYNLNN